MSGEAPSRAVALLKLLRFSLAPTVAADLAAGIALVRGGPGGALDLVKLLPASLLLFCGGMALNARVDLEEDRLARPDRPLPSGALAPGVATLLAIVGLAGGPLAAGLAFGLTAGMWAGGMALLIGLYHTPLKRSAFLGPLLLGLVRAGDLLLGAVALAGVEGGLAAAGLFAGVYGLYVTGASCIAHEEDRQSSIRVVRAGALLAGLAVVVNAALAHQRAPAATDMPIVGIIWLVALWHLISVKGGLLLFRATGIGLRSLAPFAALFLSRMTLLPTAAAFSAGAPDLALVALGAFIVVGILVRFIPPT